VPRFARKGVARVDRVAPQDLIADRLHARRGGAGEPLVLVHGIGLSLRTWNPVWAPLERSHSVLAVDLPGFGESPPLPPETPPTISNLADALERELDAEGLEAPHITGNSLGGWLALELGRRGRARSVVAISPAGMWNSRETIYVGAVLRGARAAAERIEPFADLLTRGGVGRTAALWSMLTRPWRLDPADAAYLIRALARAPGWHDTLDQTLATRAEGLADVRCPVQIAWGSSDRLLFPRQAARFVRELPDAEPALLPGLGHIPMSDDAALVSDTIVRFASRHSRAPDRVAI
jgi:pimeloyl-ACP methyl ester carboxylesterase